MSPDPKDLKAAEETAAFHDPRPPFQDLRPDGLEDVALRIIAVAAVAAAIGAVVVGFLHFG